MFYLCHLCLWERLQCQVYLWKVFILQIYEAEMLNLTNSSFDHWESQMPIVLACQRRWKLTFVWLIPNKLTQHHTSLQHKCVNRISQKHLKRFFSVCFYIVFIISIFQMHKVKGHYFKVYAIYYVQESIDGPPFIRCSLLFNKQFANLYCLIYFNCISVII